MIRDSVTVIVLKRFLAGIDWRGLIAGFITAYLLVKLLGG